MSVTQKRSAANCIGFRYSQNITDVQDMRYQAKRGEHAIYSLFDGYVCCPPMGGTPPKGWNWTPDGEAYGRTIYFATGDAT
ncbi:MAG: hypothetical protein M3R16_03640 [Pseudomonadota bacterium]|nr:hypothetical protein [Pseudomonadota bacterium]